MDKLYNHLLKKGKTDSWLNLAKQFNILPNGSNKQKSDFVRRFYNRNVLKNKYEPIKFNVTLPKEAFNNKEVLYPKIESNTLLYEFKEFLKTKKENQIEIEPFTEGDLNNILVIGDLHIPFNHSQYLSFCINLQKKWNCGKVIFIGDILDFHASSFHESDMALPSAEYELEISKIEISKWYKAFPEAVILIGNHDRMVTRKLFNSQISAHWQKSFNEVLEVPNWKFLNEYEYNNIYFCHGEGPEAAKTCLYKQMNTVQGHQHSKCYVQYPAENIFAVQCPIGVNRKEQAFNYAKTDTKPWQIGATVILNSKTPIIELI